MKKIWPYLLIILTVLIFFRPFMLKGFLPIPSDTIVGLYHPFRDMYAEQYPRGVPFKNFLITDPVRQQYPWKSLAIGLEQQLQLPLWNPYSFAGYPLLGNLQSGAFYPLNVLFFVLPFSFAWSIFILLQPLLGGIFLYVYLRHLKLHPVSCVIGSISFALSGFSIVWMEWGNVIHTLIWLPLILLAKDKLLEKWSTRWVVVFLFSEVASFFAGHLQLWFYMVIVTNLYLFIRVYQKTISQKTGNFISRYVRNYIPFLLVGIGMFAITSLQWIPTMQFIFHSARSVDQNYLTTEGWFIPYQNLLQFITPDFFGNPATLNYWGVWNYAEFVGYIGILPFLFALFAVAFRHDKKTWFFAGITLGALLFALPTPLGKLPFQLNIPFLSTSQPTRLLGIVDFCLPLLAALGADMFIRKKSFRIVWICGVVGIVFLALWVIAFKVHIDISAENIAIIKRNLVFPTIFLFVSILILVVGMIVRFKKWVVYFAIVSLVLISADLVRFADKFTPFTPSSYLFPTESTLTYLKDHIGNQRIMADDSRMMAPNFSVMYKLQSLDGYDPLYLRNYAEFTAALERGKPDIHTPFGFNRIITPHNYNSPFVDLLGVKYVLSLNELHIQKLKKVYQEGETRVYENTHVFPRAFFVEHLIPVVSQQDDIDTLYANQDHLQDTATMVSSDSLPKVLTSGTVQITSYAPNKVILTTNSSGEGFVVLTDIFYPSWTASVDGKSTKIYQADYTLRGVFVPKGRHTIAFSDHLF